MSPAGVFLILVSIRSEKGIFYGLDLGGTNFRVLRVQLGGGKSTILGCQVESQPIPRYLLSGSTEVLSPLIRFYLSR